MSKRQPGSKVVTKPAGADALAAPRLPETLEVGYAALRALEVSRAAELAALSDKLRKIEQEGSFLLGTVRAAGAPLGVPPPVGSEAVTLPGDAKLSAFLRDAESRLRSSRAALEAERAERDRAHQAALQTHLESLWTLSARYLESVRPKLFLTFRPVGTARCILHTGRLSPDASVLLFRVLNDRLPTRYEYLEDQSTDLAGQDPPSLYPEGGVDPADVRPTPAQIRALLERPGRMVPAKGALPFLAPEPSNQSRLWRLFQRGPVMELEREAGEGFQSLLSRAEGEQVAGYLLRLKLEGRLDLDVEAGDS